MFLMRIISSVQSPTDSAYRICTHDIPVFDLQLGVTDDAAIHQNSVPAEAENEVPCQLIHNLIFI